MEVNSLQSTVVYAVEQLWFCPSVLLILSSWNWYVTVNCGYGWRCVVFRLYYGSIYYIVYSKKPNKQVVVISVYSYSVRTECGLFHQHPSFAFIKRSTWPSIDSLPLKLNPPILCMYTHCRSIFYVVMVHISIFWKPYIFNDEHRTLNNRKMLKI